MHIVKAVVVPAAILLAGCSEATEPWTPNRDAGARVGAEIDRMAGDESAAARVGENQPTTSTYTPPYETNEWGRTLEEARREASARAKATRSAEAGDLIVEHAEVQREREQEARIQALEFELSH